MKCRILALGVIASQLGCADRSFVQSAKEWISQPVEIPKGAEPSLEEAARVDLVGRQITQANLFSGVEASFQVVGEKTPLLSHRDQHGIFISDSLVRDCKTDHELAAVLCSELAKIVAEQRNTTRMGYTNPMPDIAINNGMEQNGIPADQFRLAQLAMWDERNAKASKPGETGNPPIDAKQIALDLLKTSGYDAAAMEEVPGLIKNVNQNKGLVQQLSGRGASPIWSR